jgi:hypothetical protein
VIRVVIVGLSTLNIYVQKVAPKGWQMDLAVEHLRIFVSLGIENVFIALNIELRRMVAISIR